MNFKGHLTSGVVVGVGIAVGAVDYGYIDGDDLQTQAAVAVVFSPGVFWDACFGLD